MYSSFKKAVRERFEHLASTHSTLYTTLVTKEELWNTYLQSYPEGERQQHNCNSCRQFIKNCGNVVAIVDNKLISIWDVQVEEPFSKVAKALNRLVVSASIGNVFVTKIAKQGTDYNFQQVEGESPIKWEHFYAVLPKEKVKQVL
jgi:hypothetical protein